MKPYDLILGEFCNLHFQNKRNPFLLSIKPPDPIYQFRKGF